ncbi:MBL fold metallo-hydrolase [Cohnella sp. JJ-181]|uniref:MBL fold metallo-hydrolase n=1 Tax=Cohnella rhizoplanae TaxID=2974897 RepID=UPI0022FF9423|nr:MBL fold metallo-hydrolase [Cohnella sp. JJ-181]CAI6033243.1 putative metallo-hydrolase YflN [Cohnella sp. JJ-181]
MQIAEGIVMLELDLGSMTIHPTVLVDEDSWTLIDTGLPGSAAALLALAKQAGVGDRPLRAILLTHQDLDHIGGLPGILEETDGSAVVYAHPDDAGAINGTERLAKLSQERLDGFLQEWPEDVRSQFERTFLHPVRPNVDMMYKDGDTLPFGGGLTVIHTPGHTPGHVSLYHRASKTLIAGDATVARDGVLSGPNARVTPDMDMALASLGKLGQYDIEGVICYHGGWVQGGVNARFAALSEGKS